MSTLGVDTLVEETDTVGAINCPSQHAMGLQRGMYLST